MRSDRETQESCSPVLFEEPGRGRGRESLPRRERHVASLKFSGQQEGEKVRV